jgi:hypothetical protein
VRAHVARRDSYMFATCMRFARAADYNVHELHTSNSMLISQHTHLLCWIFFHTHKIVAQCDHGLFGNENASTRGGSPGAAPPSGHH